MRIERFFQSMTSGVFRASEDPVGEVAESSNKRSQSGFISFEDEWGRSVRIYVASSIPESSRPLPAVLHIPGGSQTVNRVDLKWWADRGFAAYSFDWENTFYASHDPKRKSVWPPEVLEKAKPLKTAREALLPLAVRAASVVMDWIQEDPRVEGTRIGVVGISWGGYLCWPVVAKVPRIKAMVPVFGCGGLYDARNVTGFSNISHDPAIKDLWCREWDARSLLDRIDVPVCYLSSTNDFWGAHTIAEEVLTELGQRVDLRRSSVPNQNHHTGQEQGALAVAWLKQHLLGEGTVPKEPILWPDLSIEADDSESAIASKRLWWTASGAPDRFRCWWLGTPPQGAARLVFGRVSYANGITLNTATRRLQEEPQRLEPLPATWPDCVEAGAGYQWGVCSTQFYEAGGPHAAAPKRGPVAGSSESCRITVDREGAGPFSYVFRGIADPRWNTGSIKGIQISLAAEGGDIQSMQVWLACVVDDACKEFEVPIALDGSPTSVDLELTLDRFPDLPHGTSWKDIGEVCVSGMISGNSYQIGPIRKF